ncbi:hypothetical protein Pcinc_030474 [Petrolisthes cinctipes]|uniref:Uncharacterized protein n=1 Tax=Petrolisthes cinctipes TaxID=88211 RepID=A0AAE1EYM5_PETCI|nr:hypothetical protein Pcinc_030474 [Petrolisthes cinctipes]
MQVGYRSAQGRLKSGLGSALVAHSLSGPHTPVSALQTGPCVVAPSLFLRCDVFDCLVPGYGVKISTDGHRHCSLHAAYWSTEGYDPEACEVCSPWVRELKEAPQKTRNSLNFLALIWKAWKLGLCVTWNPELGTSLPIMRHRTVSTDRTTEDPPDSVDSEMEVEDAPQARSSTLPPATGTPSSSDHGSREKSRERSRDKRERKDKKRRHRGSSSSSSPQRKKSLSRDAVASLSTQIQGLVSSLTDMLYRMIDSRLPDRSCQPSPASSLNSKLHVAREEAELTQELGFVEAHPPPEGEPSGHKRRVIPNLPGSDSNTQPSPRITATTTASGLGSGHSLGHALNLGHSLGLSSFHCLGPGWGHNG